MNFEELENSKIPPQATTLNKYSYIKTDIDSDVDYRDILKVAKPKIGKRVKRKEKSKQLDALFSPKNNLPVFMLPICKRKEIPENLVNGDDVIEKSSDKNENFTEVKQSSLS